MKRCLLTVCLASLLFQTIQADDDHNSRESIKRHAVKEAITCLGDILRIGATIGSLYLITKHKQEMLLHERSEMHREEFSSNIERRHVEEKTLPTEKQQSKTPQQDKVHWFGPLPEAAQQILDFAHNKDLYEAAGVGTNPNVLLDGPPGTGKSHLARYLAQELGVELFEKDSGSFHNMYIGVGPQAVKDLFEQARCAARRSPNTSVGALIFIDEIEGIGRKRDAGGGGSHSEEVRLLNALLTELTSPKNKNILVVCATNLSHLLDPALVRPGRFGLHVTMETPSLENRFHLFKHFLNHAFQKGKAAGKQKHTSQEEPYSEKLFHAMAASSAKFTTADIKETVERALKHAVEKRRVTTCTEQELMDALQEIQNQHQRR